MSDIGSDIGAVVIIGGGEAGFRAAKELREQGYRGSLTLVGSEPVAPYYRPPLSKGYLKGSESREKIASAPESWYEAQQIDLRTGTAVVAIETKVKQVVLQDGARLHYDRLLLAMGSRARALGLPGESLDGVVSLRSMADSDDLRERLEGANRVAVVGGGWIGLEVAAAARGADVPVTVLESADLPLLGVLGPRISQIFADLHTRHGVDLRCGVGVKGFRGDHAVTGVELVDGSVVAADLVVVGVGAAPNVELAIAAGLDVAGGVLVDEHLISSDPAILAAGDIAEAWHPVLQRRLRVEHVQTAADQGKAAARTILGSGGPYDAQPFFWSDQYDLGIEYVGHADPGAADVVLRGDVEALQFIAFWVVGGSVAAAMHCNVWDATDDLRALVSSGAQIDPASLADPGVPLSSLIS